MAEKGSAGSAAGEIENTIRCQKLSAFRYCLPGCLMRQNQRTSLEGLAESFSRAHIYISRETASRPGVVRVLYPMLFVSREYQRRQNDISILGWFKELAKRNDTHEHTYFNSSAMLSCFVDAKSWGNPRIARSWYFTCTNTT